MRTVLVLATLAAMASNCRGQSSDSPAPPPSATYWPADVSYLPTAPTHVSAAGKADKIEHLLKAAEHLEAAGLTGQASAVREQAQAEQRLRQQQLLKAKLAQLQALQAEVRQLQDELEPPRQVMLQCRLVEVSRGRLNALASYFQKTHREGLAQAMTSGIGAFDARPAKESTQITLVPRQDELHAALDALRERKLLKVLAEPCLVTLDGRPASFVQGGEYPVVSRQAEGTALQYQPFGTEVHVFPTLVGGHKVKLKLHMKVSEAPAKDSSDKCPLPAKVREIATQVEMPLGQTMVLGGLISRSDSRTTASPEDKAADSDSGNPAATQADPIDEIETLFLLTPTLVEPTTPQTTRRETTGK